jgi:hypothetical protein
MSQYNVKQITAGAALERGVLVDVSGALTTGATVTPYGVTTSGANSGSPVAICVIGLCRAQAAGAISQGAALMPAADGEVTTYDGADGSVFIGQAKEAATTQGDLIEIVFAPSLDASDAVTSTAVAAANTAGALREFSTITVAAESADDIVITLAQNVAAADVWMVNIYTAAGTLAATSAYSTAETGGNATLDLTHASLEAHRLTLHTDGTAELTVTDVSGGTDTSVYVELVPREAAQGGIAGCSYFFPITFDAVDSSP